MNTEDPLEFLAKFGAAVQTLAERQPKFAERLARHVQLYQELAVTEPLTLRARLEELYSSGELPAQLAQDLLECLAAVSSGAPEGFAYYPPAQDLNDFLEWAIGASSPDAVHRHLSAALKFDMRVLRAGLIEAAKTEESVGFERRVRTLADMLSRCAEQWYRPILGAALSIAYEAGGKVRAKVPRELGALMAAIADSDTVPPSILYDGIRIMRNATAHSGIMIDLASQTVTFVNHKRSGDTETLGPLAWGDLVRAAWGCVWAWSALALVCRRVRRLTSNEVE